MSRSSETLPPVAVEYFDDYDDYGPVTVDPNACAMTLRKFGLDDEHIASTTIAVTNKRYIKTIADPDVQVHYDYPIYSANNTILDDGSGYVELNMGCVRTLRRADMPESVLLIPGLSQRVDLVQMGHDGLSAEESAFMKDLCKRKAIKPIVKNILGAATGLGVDVLASQYDIIPTPLAWAAGVAIVGGSAIWAKTSAETEYRLEVQRCNARKQWPAQKRASQRMKEYIEDPSSPVLFAAP